MVHIVIQVHVMALVVVAVFHAVCIQLHVLGNVNSAELEELPNVLDLVEVVEVKEAKVSEHKCYIFNGICVDNVDIFAFNTIFNFESMEH